MFNNVLIKYMKMAHCSVSKLAQETGIAQSNISRYINGTRTPDPDSEIIAKMAEVLADIINNSEASSSVPIQTSDVVSEMNIVIATTQDEFPHEEFSRNLKLLFVELEISQNELAELIFVSPPTLSRIMSGNYKTRDPKALIDSLVDVTEQACQDENISDRIWNLLERETGIQRQDCQDRAELLADWLSGRFRRQAEDMAVAFVDIFREYTPEKYIKAYDIGKLRIPRTKWKLPTTKKYIGFDGMKHGFIDFFKATITSASTDDIYIYMNIPVDHFADDPNQYQQIMKVGWMMVLQGHKVYVIHNTNRPVFELRLGIETWLPLYMTGQVEPYYHDTSDDTLIYDVMLVSGAAALTGRAVKGAEDLSEYTFTKSQKHIATARAQAETMRAHCKPLVRVFDEKNKDEFEAMFLSHLTDTAEIRNTSISLPLETMEVELLQSILERNNIAKGIQKRVIEERNKRRGALDEFLEHCMYQEVVTEHQFTTDIGGKIPLAIPEWVCPQMIYYLPEEWKQHMEQTEQLARENKYYSLQHRKQPIFGNIHMHVRQNSYAVIDRYNGPELHFVFLHPLLVRSFYDFEAPITDDVM